MTNPNQDLLPGRSYLLIGQLSDGSQLLEQVAPSDRLEVDSLDLDVKQLRSLISKASLSSEIQRVIIFYSAESLSVLLQNTLLKLLEEPIATLTVVLQTEQPNQLIETIRSRLAVIYTNSRSATDFTEEALNSYTQEQLYKLERAKISSILSGELIRQSEQVLNGDYAAIKNVESLNSALGKLKHNTNLKLTLDDLYLQLGGFSGYTKD